MGEHEPKRVQLQNLASLQRWLAENQIDTGSWGRDGTKEVADLWEELRSGDCFLQAQPPLRLIDLVEVIIWRDDQVLLEVAQDLRDGSRRSRNIPPSEKMRPHEDVAAAALRGLQEELLVAPAQVRLQPGTIRQRRRQLHSPSYPGLPTQYTIHSIEALVPGLPDKPFWCENAAFAHGDPVRRQQWAWGRWRGAVRREL